MITIKKFLACVPVDKHSVELKVVGKFAMPEQKNTLLVTELMFPHISSHIGPGDLIPSGTKIFLHGDCFNHEWARRVFTHQVNGAEVKFILVPEDLVLGYQLPDQKE